MHPLQWSQATKRLPPCWVHAIDLFDCVIQVVDINRLFHADAEYYLDRNIDSAAAAVATARQPDIEYTPDYNKYTARIKRRLETEETLATKNLPAGFTRQLKSELVWEGGSIANDFDWNFILSPEHIEELEHALAHFKSLNTPPGYIDETTFPLPKLHFALRDISRELHFGHGFKVIRGNPVTRYSREDNIILSADLSSHNASLRARQDSRYNGEPADVVLSHIKDLSASKEKTALAPPLTRLTSKCSTPTVPLTGAKVDCASTWRVYNELAATRPDLIETLSQDWIADNFGNSEQPYATKPLLFHQPATAKIPERVVLQYARRYFTGFGPLPHSTAIPPITETQAEALDAYVNNLAVFHARDGFKDTPERQRHLVRLWLRDPEYCWETPSALTSKWAQLYHGVATDRQVFPLEPYVRSASNGSLKAAQ
ncbi:uncharacterized protein A1O5_08455 [Cladophialophora psammophila CBS 110553]|uniref:TauD/TfdA-like domain-containing protein n=1 Tax=Cladophialophora psammophila CBS 110553 TaxID=1182543 RepID=W9WVH9_9EURO|nr:uncharacterized protein A1O5_08455 [Cladophialophora psammophila CBS 110553]EXJ68661.1 hypothetical protein A1O5_08455 [Cladophialophora psammophila CBS 110553]